MRLEESDKKVAPTLNKILGAAGWLNYYAKDLQGAVKALPARPVWETLARDSLTAAETELMLALAMVRATRDIYDKLPVIVEPYSPIASPHMKITKTA